MILKSINCFRQMVGLCLDLEGCQWGSDRSEDYLLGTEGREILIVVEESMVKLSEIVSFREVGGQTPK